MTKQEKVKVLELITGLGELLGRELSPVAAELYLRLLEDVPYELIEDALTKLARTRRFLPTPSEVREAALGPEENYQETGMIEAAKVVGAVRTHGAYRSVVFDNPVTMAVVQQGFGGWEKLCNDLTLDQDQWFRKDFVKSYVAYLRAGIRSFGVLYGITDRQNSASGFGGEERAPVLIGDREKCLTVLNYKTERLDQPGGRKLMVLARRVGA